MFDKVTEIVAHMIGIFHITIEEERMRDVYAKFKALQQADPEAGDLLNIAVKFSAPYSLKDFAPALKYANPGPEQAPEISGNGVYVTPLSLPQFLLFDNAQIGALQDIGPLAFAAPSGTPILTLEPPGSVAIFSFQTAWMRDDDLLFLNEDKADFVDPAEFLQELQNYYAVGQTLGSITSDVPYNFSESTLVAAKSLRDAMSATNDTPVIGETVTVVHGEDAYGGHVNGETVEEVPLLDDVMPAFFKAENEDVTLQGVGAADEDDPDAIENTDPFQGLEGPSPAAQRFEVDEGHQVVSGANVLINDATIAVGWLDAPVISVMGDVVNLTSISQVNVLIEHANINGAAGTTLSATFNVAMMSLVSSNPEPEGTPSEDTEAGPLGLPENWAVTRIDGDILAVNWVSQFSFMTDFDRADVQFTGTNTYIGLGDNTIVNLVDLAEIGYGYDLIMIGGNLITINQISQMNILMDNDTITSTAGVPYNFSGSDNLLFNGASISTVGIDTYSQMSSNFEAASDAFADGAETLSESVARDSVFEGDDILTVLYIDGDLTTINWLEQTNVMGDSDQINVALDNFAAQTGASVQLVSGSNTAINLASVEIYGVDSEVQVNGEVYSDALLYQANLIDTDSDPLGVSMPALATEAVAFLADGMIGTATEAPSDSEIFATTPEYSGSPDLMQTMLA